MVVILDANQLYSDWRLATVYVTALVRYLAATGSQLAMPRVVLEELVNQYGEQIARHIGDVRQGARKLDALTGRKLPIKGPLASLQAPEEAGEYRKQLLARLDALGIRVTELPGIAHERLLAADLSRRKPFSPSGRGYRDALIWCSVLEAAVDGTEVVFISDNSKDFPTDDDGRLGGDLEDWFTDGDLDYGQVRIFRSLKAFLESKLEEVNPDEIDRLLIVEGRHRRLDMADLVSEWRKRIETGVNSGLQEYHREAFEDPSLAYQLEAPEVEDISVRVVDNDTLLVEAQLNFGEVLIEHYVYRSDAWDPDYQNLSMTEWNEWYYQAQTYMDLSAELSVTFDRTKQQVEDVQVTGVHLDSDVFHFG